MRLNAKYHVSFTGLFGAAGAFCWEDIMTDRAFIFFPDNILGLRSGRGWGFNNWR
jgi:hypothetical protein